jgi:hypothetical protein
MLRGGSGPVEDGCLVLIVFAILLVFVAVGALYTFASLEVLTQCYLHLGIP